MHNLTVSSPSTPPHVSTTALKGTPNSVVLYGGPYLTLCVCVCVRVSTFLQFSLERESLHMLIKFQNILGFVPSDSEMPEDTSVN